MRYNLLSYHYLIDRLRRDTGLSDMNLDPDNLRDWIAEAIRGLEARGQFSTRTVDIAYENHRAKLPTDWAGYTSTNDEFHRHYNELQFKRHSGTARITYLVLPVDTEGMPMLIDHPRVLDYIFWFTCEKLSWLDLIPPKFTPQVCVINKLDNLKCAQIDLSWPTQNSSRILGGHH